MKLLMVLKAKFRESNTEGEVDYVLEVVPKIVARLREMSPLWEDVAKQEDAKCIVKSNGPF